MNPWDFGCATVKDADGEYHYQRLYPEMRKIIANHWRKIRSENRKSAATLYREIKVARAEFARQVREERLFS